MFGLLLLILGVLVVIVKEIHDVAEELRENADDRQESFIKALGSGLEPIDEIRGGVTDLRDEVAVLRKLVVLRTDPSILKKLIKEIEPEVASSEEMTLLTKLLDGISQEDFIEWRDSRLR